MPERSAKGKRLKEPYRLLIPQLAAEWHPTIERTLDASFRIGRQRQKSLVEMSQRRRPRVGSDYTEPDERWRLSLLQ